MPTVPAAPSPTSTGSPCRRRHPAAARRRRSRARRSRCPARSRRRTTTSGGEGIAYHDTTAGNSGGAYRSNNVDITKTSDSSGGYNLKSVRAGEWLAYSVSVAKAGSYTVDLRIASDGPGGAVHLTVDGADVTGSNQLPDTGGWDTWKTVSKSGVALPQGNHVLKLVIDANGSGRHGGRHQLARGALIPDPRHTSREDFTAVPRSMSRYTESRTTASPRAARRADRAPS